MRLPNRPEDERTDQVKKRPGSNKILNVISGFRVVALPIFLLVGASSVYTCYPKKEKTEEVKKYEVLNYEMGNWKYQVVDFKEETFHLEEGDRFFYDYIKSKLSQTTGVDLSYKKDLEVFTNAYIQMTRESNPHLNLDNVDSIQGKKIILPAKILFTPREGNFFRSRFGYEYLRDAAREDGMDISDESQREKIYNEACKLPLMPDSEYYACKDTGSDCKESCAIQSQETYQKFAKEFFERSGGVKLVYNDLMRDEATEKSIVDSGKGGTQLGSTHITGSSLDQSVKRFVINGKMVFVDKATDEELKDIKERLLPLLKEILSEYFNRGEILVVDETHGNSPHYHLYLPLNIKPLHPQVVELDFKKKPQKILNEDTLLTREKEGTKYYTFTVPDWKLTRMLDALCTSSNEETIEAIKKINEKDHISPNDIIWIPVELMKPDLRDPKLSIVENPNGINKDVLSLYNPNRKEDSYRVPTALLKQQ